MILTRPQAVIEDSGRCSGERWVLSSEPFSAGVPVGIDERLPILYLNCDVGAMTLERGAPDNVGVSPQVIDP